MLPSLPLRGIMLTSQNEDTWKPIDNRCLSRLAAVSPYLTDRDTLPSTSKLVNSLSRAELRPIPVKSYNSPIGKTLRTRPVTSPVTASTKAWNPCFCMRATVAKKTPISGDANKVLALRMVITSPLRLVTSTVTLRLRYSSGRRVRVQRNKEDWKKGCGKYARLPLPSISVSIALTTELVEVIIRHSPRSRLASVRRKTSVFLSNVVIHLLKHHHFFFDQNPGTRPPQSHWRNWCHPVKLCPGQLKGVTVGILGSV